jgi:hypothetical protein
MINVPQCHFSPNFQAVSKAAAIYKSVQAKNKYGAIVDKSLAAAIAL